MINIKEIVLYLLLVFQVQCLSVDQKKGRGCVRVGSGEGSSQPLVFPCLQWLKGQNYNGTGAALTQHIPLAST